MIRKTIRTITAAIGAAVALAPTVASARGGGGHGGGGHGGGFGGGHGGGFGAHSVGPHWVAVSAELGLAASAVPAEAFVSAAFGAGAFLLRQV